jgi:hypothetical protein
MTVWADIRGAIRQAMVLQDRVKRLIADAGKTEDLLLDHDRRLTRIEALITLAQDRRLPRDGQSSKESGTLEISRSA